METNQPITLPPPPPPSSPCDDDPLPDPQSAADELDLNHLQIHPNDDKKEQHVDGDDDVDDADADVDDDDDEDDFTFVWAGDEDEATELYKSGSGSGSGQIRTVFPLFDQSLLDVDVDEKRRLPIDVAVDNVFVESPHRSPSHNGDTNGTIRVLSKESDMNIKSNSTGFSKLWRFKNEMNRSNSDGRDAFVFLNNRDSNTTSSGDSKRHDVVSVSGGKEKEKGVVKEKGKGVGLKGVKVKKSTPSAHEVYLKQKEGKGKGKTEEERRRSYLPYRPGLMGFFTNVNGGLSKNVHPF